jgi:hypothetical protein
MKPQRQSAPHIGFIFLNRKAATPDPIVAEISAAGPLGQGSSFVVASPSPSFSAKNTLVALTFQWWEAPRYRMSLAKGESS